MPEEWRGKGHRDGAGDKEGDKEEEGDIEEEGWGIRKEVVFRISFVENSNTNFTENREGREEKAKTK